MRKRTSRPPRARRLAGLAVLALVATACTAGPAPTEDPGGQPSSDSAPACSSTAGDAQTADESLAAARPGDTVCLQGDGFAGAELVMTSSGTPAAPIVVSGADTVLASMSVEADHVIVQGLRTEGGSGILLTGAGLVARDNTVLDATASSGIACLPCDDATIEGNTVARTDGTGIFIEGNRITVRDNEVSESVRIDARDADGIRFFGTGHRIEGNLVRDIKDDGYARPPHTDCFQTFDNSGVATTDVVISDNICRNVDHQCLIATAEESGSQGRVGASRGIVFVGNTCDVEGSQALLIGWFPDVVVEDNVLTGPRLDRGAIFLDGSTGGRFLNNTVSIGGSDDYVRPYQVDEESEPGFVAVPAPE